MNDRIGVAAKTSRRLPSQLSVAHLHRLAAFLLLLDKLYDDPDHWAQMTTSGGWNVLEALRAADPSRFVVRMPAERSSGPIIFFELVATR